LSEGKISFSLARDALPTRGGNFQSLRNQKTYVYKAILAIIIYVFVLHREYLCPTIINLYQVKLNKKIVSSAIGLVFIRLILE